MKIKLKFSIKLIHQTFYLNAFKFKNQDVFMIKLSFSFFKNVTMQGLSRVFSTIWKFVYSCRIRVKIFQCLHFFSRNKIQLSTKLPSCYFSITKSFFIDEGQKTCFLINYLLGSVKVCLNCEGLNLLEQFILCFTILYESIGSVFHRFFDLKQLENSLLYEMKRNLWNCIFYAKRFVGFQDVEKNGKSKKDFFP